MTTKPTVTPKAKSPAAKKKAAGVSARAPGRPSAYSVVLGTKICDAIASGTSLRKVCEVAGMPTKTMVLRWLAEESLSEFRDQYARAREAQADFLAEEMLDIADEDATVVRGEEVVFDATAVARNRLRVDTRKWLASKMAPKKYGDKITAEHTGRDGGAIQSRMIVEIVRPPAREDDE